MKKASAESLMPDKPTVVLRTIEEGKRERQCEIERTVGRNSVRCPGAGVYYYHLPGEIRIACEHCAGVLRRE